MDHPGSWKSEDDSLQRGQMQSIGGAADEHVGDDVDGHDVRRVLHVARHPRERAGSVLEKLNHETSIVQGYMKKDITIHQLHQTSCNTCLSHHFVIA